MRYPDPTCESGTSDDDLPAPAPPLGDVASSSNTLGVWQPTLTRELARQAAAAMGISEDALRHLMTSDQ